MMIEIPKFRRIDGLPARYEAMTGDGARLVVLYDRRWDSWFWRVCRSGAIVVAGGAPDLHEAQERAISAWIAVR